MEKPTKQNSLYLTIKQENFDKILDGTKKTEERDISPGAYKKYLECDEEGCPYCNADFWTDEDFDIYPGEDLLMACKDGKFPFFFREDIMFLNLAVGYNKVRDTAIVEVTDITPMMGKNKKGETLRFDFDKNGKVINNPEGKYCMWQAVFHLGKVVEKNIVSK